MFIGTLGSEIYQVQIDIAKKTMGQPKALINGHFSPCNKDNNEVWGMSIFPKSMSNIYVTASDDATLRVWDAKTKKQIKWIPLNVDQAGNLMPTDTATSELSNATKARSVDVSPDGKLCAVGFRDGSFRIYETKEWKMVAKKKASEKWI